LENISFQVKQGEVLGIIGKNGAGKSTLLKILSKVTSPTKGNVKIKGRIASLLEVGTGFHGDLSGRENIFLNGAILGMTKAEIKSKFDEIVDFSGVERYIDTPVKRYSSGMYVRLAFAVAAHLEPEILIIDEVLAVGDAEFQKKCLGKMKDVSEKDGRTVLFVSHSMGSIMTLCNVTALIQNGKLVHKSSTKEVVDHYLETLSNKIITSKRNINHLINNDIIIEDVDFTNSENIQKINFSTDENIYVAIDIIVNKYNENAVLGFYLKDNLQRKIFTSQYSLKNTNANEKIHLVACIPPQFLTPQKYSFTAAVHIPKARVIDIYEDAKSFTIVDSGTAFSLYEAHDYGCVFADIKWESR